MEALKVARGEAGAHGINAERRGRSHRMEDIARSTGLQIEMEIWPK